MNEVIKNILNRRSVREYLDEQIKQEDLDLILKAGQYAPSAHRLQPWHFTVVQNKSVMDTLNIDTKKAMAASDADLIKGFLRNPDFNIFYNAPTVIVVSGERSWIEPVIDCAAATENMLLAAESLGIGACWIGFVIFIFGMGNFSKYLELLEIPEGYQPLYAISLGYKKHPSPEALPRREGTVNYIR